MENKVQRLDTKPEEWKIILEANNYLISSYGRIKRINTNQFLTPKKHKNGHYFIKVRNNRRNWQLFKICDLVGKYFIQDEIKKGYVWHHKDLDRLNNSVDNLELMRKETSNYLYFSSR